MLGLTNAVKGEIRKIMRRGILTILALAILPVMVRADDKFAVLQANGVTYSNVTVTTVSATDIYFTYDGGLGNVKLKYLSPDLQQRFHYDPEKAGLTELSQQTNQIKYYQGLIHQPVVNPPDMTRPPGSQLAWHDAFTDVLGMARNDKKLVLVAFTGSDWDSWSIKFEQEVLSTDRFAGYADQKLELARIDFLHNSPQSEQLQQANETIRKQYNVDRFPTYILLTGEGRELGRQIGYREGGPDAFISELEEMSKRSGTQPSQAGQPSGS